MELNITNISQTSDLYPDTGARYQKNYQWLDICFDTNAAADANQKREAFQRGATWYASYRWLYGKRNAFLDAYIDSGKFTADKISRQEYNLYYRNWLKRLRLHGW